jgi:hypothetical protein
MVKRKYKYNIEKAEVVLDANEAVCLEVNAEKTNYPCMLMSRLQTTGPNH